MNQSFATTARKTSWVIAITVGIAFVLAIVLLGIAQSFPDSLDSGRIQIGDYSTTIAGAFSGGILEFLVASGAVTLCILAVLAAVIFATLAIMFAFGIIAGALLLSALLVALPLIVVGALIWRAARSKKTSPAIAAASASPSPQN